jgi:hypothetical protein
MGDDGLMTIEELARRADTATTTVRMYQTKGLLPPPERRERTGYYGKAHLSRLRLIAGEIAERFTRVFERHTWKDFTEAGMPSEARADAIM